MHRFTFAFALFALIASGQGKKDKALRKELASGWTIWPVTDVQYIITDEEKKAFDQLATDEEREQFVEQFWLRRDPTPDTVENEYKEEHYRRLAYANDHFASGVPGWRTDRGRIYIRFGPPDEIESHPSGGSYERPAAQGGGQTSVYPFEQWRYRHLDNVGEDVVVEFVDPTLTGEYRLTIDPCEKDALTNVPGAGPTLAEQIGLSTRLARFQNTDGTHCGAPLGGKSVNDNPFTRLETLANLERAPALRFRDLEAVVESRIAYNVLPMQVHVDYLRMTEFSTLANITVQFENKDLETQSKDGVGKAVVNLLGRVYTLTRRPVATFEKPLEIPMPLSRRRSVWQESLPLAPGRYKLVLAAKDVVSGNLNNIEVALDVPRYEEGKLAASSLILADDIARLPTKGLGAGMFAVGDMRVRPRISGEFAQSEKLGFYLQIYNARQPDVEYEVVRAGTRERILGFSEGLASASELFTVQKFLPLSDLAPGAYALRVKIADGDRSVSREVNFSVTP